MEIRDQLEELYEALLAEPELEGVLIKSYTRPEELDETEPSIILIPIGPPMQSNAGSDIYLTKKFMGTSKNQLSSIISKKEETLALQFPARVPVFPTFLSLLSGEF